MDTTLLAHNGIQDGHPDATGQPDTIDTTVQEFRAQSSETKTQNHLRQNYAITLGIVLLVAIVVFGLRWRAKRLKKISK